MIEAMRQFGDWILGRGEASITIPIFDGALKPNQMLEEAEVVAEFEDASDIAADRDGILVADGSRVVRLAPLHSNGEVAAPVPSVAWDHADGGARIPNTAAASDPSVAGYRDTSPSEWGRRLSASKLRDAVAPDGVGEGATTSRYAHLREGRDAKARSPLYAYAGWMDRRIRTLWLQQKCAYYVLRAADLVRVGRRIELDPAFGLAT